MPAEEEWIMIGKLHFFAPQNFFVSKLLKTQLTASYLSSIYTHTFNQQLFNGTLSSQAFGKYLHDDYIYLHHYAIILAKLATRVQNINDDLAQHLIKLSTGIVADEQRMQERYKEYFTHTPESTPGDAISTYIDFLTEHAESAELPVALCSILPCFWIYAELGSMPLHPEQLTCNPYKEWIETYSSKEFIEATNALVVAVNQLANNINVKTEEQMSEVFNRAVQLELQFLDEVEPKQELVLV